MSEIDPIAQKLIQSQDEAIAELKKQIEIKDQLINDQNKMIEYLESHIEKLYDLIDQFPR